jgi:hypothetical protein
MHFWAKSYCLELDGATYRVQANRLEQVTDLKAITGDRWVVSDLQLTMARTLTIEGSPKYVELLTARKLQEAGEFDEPVTVIPHWKKRRGKNTTEIFFTALPTRLLHQYHDQVRTHDDNLMLFPLYSILYGILRRIAPKEPAAIVFQHNRFADLIVGEKNRVWHANRFVAFDTSAEQAASLWETLHSSLNTVEFDHRIAIKKVYLLDWIDSGPQPVWPEADERQVYRFESEALVLDDKTYEVSFLKAVKNQTGARAISPPLERVSYYARRGAPYVNALFLVLTLVLLGGYFWCQQRAVALTQDLRVLEAAASKIELQAPPEIALDELKQTVRFLNELAYYRGAPSYKKVVDDISEGLTGETVLENLKIDYTQDQLQVEIYGRTAAPFETAYKGYQTLQALLRRKGYTIEVQRFDTEIQHSAFLVKFSKRIG